ncbi:MAG: AAA family ATPase [Leifsonia sp.]
MTASDGTTVAIPESGVVVFVGPNNAGKSQSLKDLIGHVRNGPTYGGTTISAVTTSKAGSHGEAAEWASAHLPRVKREGVERMLVPGWGEVAATDFGQQWVGGGPGLSVLTDAMMLYADGTTRLTAGNAQPSLDFRIGHPVHPIQRAYKEPALEREFSGVGESAFGMEVVVDRYSGSVIPLRVGKRPDFEHIDGLPTQAYLEALSAVPQLEQQGDGVKSFLGLMIQLIGGNHEAILVDEPEAFLHPPQARLLGRLLAQRASGQQVFLATHSAAILQGVLEAGTAVTIIRLTREGGVNRAAVLDDSALQELWADPLLRYSDVLDGLFYDAVILCESDSDCRYYAAVRDRLFPEGEGAHRRLELLFAHCGGKARLSVVIRALRAVQVPVVVIADFDVLRIESDVQRAAQALGCDWDRLASKRKMLADALTSESKPLRKTAVRDALNARMDEAAEVLGPSDIDALRSILKVETGWDKVKRAGLSAVPQGPAYAAAEELLHELQNDGLLVVPVGELERFVPAVSGHGPAWVNEVLAGRHHDTPSAEATAFVTALELTARSKSGRNGLGSGAVGATRPSGGSFG